MEEGIKLEVRNNRKSKSKENKNKTDLKIKNC